MDRGPAHGQPLSFLDRHPRQPAAGGRVLRRVGRRDRVGAGEAPSHTGDALRQPQKTGGGGGTAAGYAGIGEYVNFLQIEEKSASQIRAKDYNSHK